MLQPKITVFIAAKDIIIDTSVIDHAVKIIHIPTNTITEYNRYKSSHKNKIEAMLALKKTLHEMELKKHSTKLCSY